LLAETMPGSAMPAAKFSQRLGGAICQPRSETFYNSVEHRPQVRLRNGEREILWPANEFSYARDTRHRTIIEARGAALRWHTYIDSICRSSIPPCRISVTWALLPM
jgi:hypothetical protein